MSRYIDAEKTKEHKFSGVQFERYSKILSDGREKTEAEIYAYKVGYNDAIDSIADFEPTADVRENVHAKWKIYNILDYANRPTGRRVGQCSNCGQLTPEWRKLLEEPLWYFCPKCGAQMDERREE